MIESQQGPSHPWHDLVARVFSKAPYLEIDVPLPDPAGVFGEVSTA